MPRFHDEFFRSGSSEHDKLVAFTIKNIQPIVRSKWREIFPTKTNELIWICKPNAYPWCTSKEEVAFSHEPLCFSEAKYGNVLFKAPHNTEYRCAECDYVTSDRENAKEHSNYKHQMNANKTSFIAKSDEPPTYCKLFLRDIDELVEIFNHTLIERGKIVRVKHVNSKGRGHWGDSDYVSSVKPESQDHLCIGQLALKQILHKSETEKLCKSGKFIIGFADIVFDFSLTFNENITIRKDWIWNDFKTHNHELRLVVEAKPHLESWGGPLRQIKTYMDILGPSHNPTYGLISTFSKLDNDSKKILSQEKVFVVTFSRDGDPLLD